MSVTLLRELDIRDSYGNIMCKALCPVCNKEFVCRKSELNSRKSCGCSKGNRSVNTYKELGEITEIYDSKGNKTLVDSEDVPLLRSHYWYEDSRGYWLSHFPEGRVYLHKYVMKVDSKYQVDHVHRVHNDNRKSQLRKCSQSENNRNRKVPKNSTGVVGVYYSHGKYSARVYIKGKEIRVGRFDTIEEASKARKEAVNKYYGEFGGCVNE